MFTDAARLSAATRRAGAQRFFGLANGSRHTISAGFRSSNITTTFYSNEGKNMKLWQPVFAAAALLAGSSAWAQTASGDFRTIITIQPVCKVTTSSNEEGSGSSDIKFQDSNATATGTLTKQSAFTVACSNTTKYSVGLQPQSTGSTTGSGEMKLDGTSDTHKVTYQLHQHPSNAIWGSDTATNNVVSNKVGRGFSNPESFDVIGTLEASQLRDLPPGKYSDTVTVTVTY